MRLHWIKKIKNYNDWISLQTGSHKGAEACFKKVEERKNKPLNQTLSDLAMNTSNGNHCVKGVQIRSLFWSEYQKIRTRKNSVFGHFSHCKHQWHRIVLTYSRTIFNRTFAWLFSRNWIIAFGMVLFYWRYVLFMRR